MKIEADIELHLLVKDAVLAVCIGYYKDKLLTQIEGCLSLVFHTGEQADIVITEIIDGEITSDVGLDSEIAIHRWNANSGCDAPDNDFFGVEVPRIETTDKNSKAISDLLGIRQPTDCCCYCKKPFWTKSGLQRHLKRVHSEQNLIQSTPEVIVYDESINEEELVVRDHFKEEPADDQDKATVYLCPECQNQYSNRDSLAEHMNSIHGYFLQITTMTENCKGEAEIATENYKGQGKMLKKNYQKEATVYLCPDCQSQYSTKDSLMKHVNSSHGYCLQIVGETKYENVQKMYENTFKYKNHKRLVQRVLKFHTARRVTGSILNKEVKKWGRIPDDLMTLANNVFECSICFERFCTRNEWHYHYKNCHKCHRCDYCRLDFVGYVGLREHSKACHSGEDLKKKLICEFCSKRFLVMTLLTDHIQSKHFGVVFPCDICNKVLGSAVTLKIHKKIHNSATFKTCEICGEQFTRYVGFIRHLRRFHPSSVPEKYRTSFKCDECGKSFSMGVELRRHVEETHLKKGLPCDVCGKVFPKRNLARHKRTHNHGSRAVS